MFVANFIAWMEQAVAFIPRKVVKLIEVFQSSFSLLII